jgi:hypothetical protein
MALVERRWDPVSLLNGEGIKRIHPAGRRAFPWGVPPPYAYPQPTFLGGEPARVKCEAEGHALDNTRFEWIKQSLNAILAHVKVPAVATATTQTADTVPQTARLLAHERLALDLLQIPPLGDTHKRSYWKDAEPMLKAHDIKTSRTVFFAARKYLRECLSALDGFWTGSGR